MQPVEPRIPVFTAVDYKGRSVVESAETTESIDPNLVAVFRSVGHVLFP